MNGARNAKIDSAIRIASYVIQMLNSDEMNVIKWFDYYNIIEIAIEKWKKPQKHTLIHDYIKDLYLFSQDYILGKHIPVEEIKEMQSLLDNYKIDYGC